MPVIDASDLYKSHGERPVLVDLRLTIRSGERVGLVGRNGSGKSTLARILAGLEEPDRGEIATRRGARVAYLEQEPQLPEEASIRQAVAAALGDWSRARARHDDATRALEAAADDEVERHLAAQAEASEAVERLGGWDRLHEADAALSDLGLPDADRPVASLSGGERRRVAIARLLLGAPDLAILDEPTNHLDVGTIEWLEQTLQRPGGGALLLITHDRYLLDRVTERTLELHDGQLDSYEGGYARYLEARAEREAQAERVERNRQNFLRRELEWLRRQPKARSTKQKARLARAHDALATEAPRSEREADFRSDAPRQGRQILGLEGVSIERGGATLIRDLDLAISAGERIGIVGPNGSGKSSLLLALQEELPLAAGHIELGQNSSLAFLDQARSGLDDALTVREAVGGERDHMVVGGESLRVGAYLERFLFDAAAQRKKVGVLSGGERARVCLAKLLAEPANLLLLDEPTNDLDVGTLSALEQMLIDFPGSALIVSHDRWFLDRVATSILAFEGDGVVDLHRGHYSDYRERRDAALARDAARPRDTGRQADTPRGRSRATKPKKLGYVEQRELDALPDRIEAAESAVAALEAQLADPELYREGAANRASALNRELEAARAEAVALTERWEELELRQAELSGA